MEFYLVRKYLVNAFAFMLGLSFMSAIFYSASEIIPTALFWAALFATGYTYREFKLKGIWPLYDNLRINRFRVFLPPFLALIIVSFLLRAWL